MAIIHGANALPPTNHSEHWHNLAKWLAKPDWLEEVEGIRERSSPTDSQVTRVYKCPWSQRFTAYEWLLGYSYSEKIPPPDPPPGGPVDPNPPAKYRLRRVIPAQDPERPWLWCSEVELHQTHGAWVPSPTSVVRDAAGNPVVVPVGLGLVPIYTGASHYVDNNRQGVAGVAQAVAGFGPAPGRPPRYDFGDGVAFLRATYRPRKHSVLSDEGHLALNVAAGQPENFELTRWVERQVDYSIEGIPIARWGQNLQYAEGDFRGRPIPEAGIKQNPTSTLHYTWHEVPDPPYAAYFACVGRVNTRAFDGHGGAPAYPEGTLLCMPWKLERKEGLTGRVVWTITYRFQHRAQGWNKFPAANGNFYLATFGGQAAGEKVYADAEFHSLFMPVAPIRYVS